MTDKCARATALATVFLAGTALTSAALAADIEASSRITAVTLYPDGAIVSRAVEVDLPAGGNTLVFRGLPLTIDPASIRIEGQATGALTLGAVDTRLRPVDPARAGSEAENQLRTLREALGKADSLIATLEGKRSMIQRYADAGAVGGDKPALPKIEDWAAAWEAVGGALAKVNDQLRIAGIERQMVVEKIKALELSETTRRSRVAPEREFTVALDAAQPVKGALTLSYRVHGASWRPAYDARLTTAEAGKAGGLALVRRAIVTQRTGEDWSDVDLALSTVRAARGTAAPEVDPLRVTFFEPPIAYGRPRADAMLRESTSKAAPAPSTMAQNAEPAIPPAQRMAVQEAALETNGFQASYRLPGKLTVPMDGTQKSFIIQTREVQPELLVKSAPALDPTAYLEAAFVNNDDAPLLPGEVTLVRDNNFVGRGRLAFTPPGEKVSLGFGADDRVKVTRIPIRRRETEPYLLGATKTDTRDFKITVKNLHDFPIKTTIVDQLPFSEAANLTIDPLPTNTPPTEKAVQDKRGVMAWSYDLKPKEEKEIRLGYRLRYPSDREIIMQSAPNPK